MMSSESRPQQSRLVSIGAGGFARDVLDGYEACYATGCRPPDVLGVPDNHEEAGCIVNAEPVLGGIDWLALTIWHPRAPRTKRIASGGGTVLAAGGILTNQIRISAQVHSIPDSTVAHECTIDDFVTVGPSVRISGHVVIDTGANIGTGAAIIQQKRIGAGAITPEIAAKALAIGITATAVKELEQ